MGWGCVCVWGGGVIATKLYLLMLFRGVEARRQEIELTFVAVTDKQAFSSVGGPALHLLPSSSTSGHLPRF